ncbi:unnamed protein product [Closterium sp. Naga37s-1]|nr:unnamed protein product [Closterium sp. Naga37s-1]
MVGWFGPPHLTAANAQPLDYSQALALEQIYWSGVLSPLGEEQLDGTGHHWHGPPTQRSFPPSPLPRTITVTPISGSLKSPSAPASLNPDLPTIPRYPPNHLSSLPFPPLRAITDMPISGSLLDAISSALSSLTALAITDTPISGSLLDAISSALSSVTALAITDTPITGSLPDAFSALSNLSSLTALSFESTRKPPSSPQPNHSPSSPISGPSQTRPSPALFQTPSAPSPPSQRLPSPPSQRCKCLPLPHSAASAFSSLTALAVSAFPSLTALQVPSPPSQRLPSPPSQRCKCLLLPHSAHLTPLMSRSHPTPLALPPLPSLPSTIRNTTLAGPLPSALQSLSLPPIACCPSPFPPPSPLPLPPFLLRFPFLPPPSPQHYPQHHPGGSSPFCTPVSLTSSWGLLLSLPSFPSLPSLPSIPSSPPLPSLLSLPSPPSHPQEPYLPHDSPPAPPSPPQHHPQHHPGGSSPFCTAVSLSAAIPRDERRPSDSGSAVNWAGLGHWAWVNKQAARPDYFGSLSDLFFLDVFSNAFEGPIPDSLTLLTNLVLLKIGNWHLNGSIPGDIGNLKALTFLELQGADMDGPFPESVTQLTNLESQSLPPSHSLPLPPSPCLSPLHELQGADMDGPFPESVTQLTNLELFHLGLTGLHGSLPDGIGDLTKLSNL